MSKRLQASGCKLAPQCQDIHTPGGCQLLHVHDTKKPLQHAAQLVQARCARSLSAATHKMYLHALHQCRLAAHSGQL